MHGPIVYPMSAGSGHTLSDPEPAKRALSEPGVLPAARPQQDIVDLAVEVSGWSPCRSKRGAVLFRGENVVTHGHNYKPRAFACDESAECKATCRFEAIHAEQQALMAAGYGVNGTHGAAMLHAKTVDGVLVPSGGPSCVECSKLALVAGVTGIWLYEADGWHWYEAETWHRLSLQARAEAPARPHPADQGHDGSVEQPRINGLIALLESACQDAVLLSKEYRGKAAKAADDRAAQYGKAADELRAEAAVVRPHPDSPTLDELRTWTPDALISYIRQLWIAAAQASRRGDSTP